MAIGATLHTFDVQLADVDRGVYEDLSLRVARHPSETASFMLTRLLAYCLEFTDGIAFSEGISAADEPAVLARDLTGALTTWIEIGAPDAARLHTGSLRASRVAVYTHRDARKVAAAWSGKRVHRAEDIPLYSFDGGFVDEVASGIARRNAFTVSVTERHLYVELNGRSAETDIHEVRVSDL